MSNVSILNDFYDAFGRGDIDAMLKAFDPKIEWQEAESHPYQPSGKPWIGGDAVLQNLFMRIGQEWDGFAIAAKTFYDVGDAVIVEGRYTGTFKATGKSLDAQCCVIWKIQNGKLTSFQQYLDTAQLKDVMGIQ